jgi:hypothetical protein
MKASGILLLLLFLAGPFSSFGIAQSSSVDRQSDEISLLRGQVTSLAERQEEILDRLS